jgi:hypothetical protein
VPIEGAVLFELTNTWKKKIKEVTQDNTGGDTIENRVENN